MHFVIILGNSGAGKTTLATKISNENDIAHLDLDILAWSEDKVPTRKPLEESIESINAFLRENKHWIIEGCYADLLDYVSKEADEMLFLNVSVNDCIENCNTRSWEPHKYASKEEQDKNLDMLLGWVKEYYVRDDVFSLKSHTNLFKNFKKKKRMLSNGNEYII